MAKRINSDRRCSIEGCDKPHEARGWCAMHYLRWKKHGDVLWRDGVYQLGRDPVCTVKGCDQPAKGRGLCGKHYQRFMAHGDVHRQIRRANGEGTITRLGYVSITVPPETPNAFVFFDRSDGRNRRKAQMLKHRFVMQEHLGRPLDRSETVHHKNGDRTDNRIENLELWSGRHPAGQRVEDLVAWAEEILTLYASQRPQPPAHGCLPRAPHRAPSARRADN